MNRSIKTLFTAMIALSAAFAAAGEIRTLELRPAKGMTRANLSYIEPAADSKPRGFLLLASGYNSDGTFLIKKPEWREFAEKFGLIPVGLSFASELPNLRDGTGYYYASKGSGKVLLDGLEKIAGGELPIYMCGFSGGAHFVARFAEWKPGRVGAFCAYAAGWWDYPRRIKDAPCAIIACGEKDERLKACFDYFSWGRRLGRKWTWIELAGTGHSHSGRLDEFVREYFGAIMDKKPKRPVCENLDTGKIQPEMFARSSKTLQSYYPDEKLAKSSPHSRK